MARILLATQAATGHVRPVTSVARRLVRRGHEVRWYTDPEFKSQVTATGARFCAPSSGAFLRMDRLDESFPELVGMSQPARASWFIENVFVAPALDQYRDLTAVLDDFPADVVVADSTLLSAGLLHEVHGRLWATLSVAPLAIPDPDVPPFGPGWQPGGGPVQQTRNRMMRRMADQTVLKAPTRRINEQRAALGLPPLRSVFDGNATPYLYMQATTPSFEYPRRNPPPQLHFVGPLFADDEGAAGRPSWWDELEGSRPTVLVTQGTSSTADDLIARTVRALSGGDQLVVATTDKTPGELGVDPAADDVRVAPFLPLDDLMRKVDVVVTNGGYGTVQLALRHAVPLVVAGQSEDKPEVCARVAWSGAGIDLRTNRPEPARIADAVSAVLTDDRYCAAARRIAAEFARYDGPERVAVLLEQLVADRAPVLAGVP